MIERCVLLGREPLVSADELPRSIRSSAAATIGAVADVIALRELQQHASSVCKRVDGRKTLTSERRSVDFKTLNRWLGASDGSE